MKLLSQKSWTQVVDGVDRSVQRVSEEVAKEVTKVRDTVEEDKLRRANADKETREKNVVIFGIKESDDHKADVLAVQDLLDRQVFLPFNVQSSDLARIGRKSNEKIRPVKLTLWDKETKWEVLKRINKMEIRGVFARPDLNREEQETDFKLRKSLKMKREEDPDGHWKIIKGEVKKVNAPPSSRRRQTSRQDSITEEDIAAAETALGKDQSVPKK